MSSIVWLASYPKSGNTWLRAFLANYVSDAAAPVDINQLPQFSLSDNHVRPYEDLTGRPATALSPREIQALRPRVHAAMANSAPGAVLVKTHTAIAALDGISTIAADVTACAVYIIRNPFDMVVSFADHYGLTLDKAIKAINFDNNITLTNARNIFQLLSSWSAHVRSWAVGTPFGVHVMRYEDMSAQPEAAFAPVVEFLKLPLDAERLRRAIEFSAFDVLAGQEKKSGFIERSQKSERFFRAGKVGGWRKALSEAQAQAIVARHRDALIEYGYLSADGTILV
ncbi:MAG: sulfotransferase domain-containing protein [Proteobacteria bacterium]|nr:sulfotransferase domain-containing protein [Pseudomonadota bacterium]